MKIPSPAHTISQNNIRESSEQDQKVQNTDEKLVDNQTNESNDEVNETDQSKKEHTETEIKNDEKSDVEEKQNNEDKSK